MIRTFFIFLLMMLLISKASAGPQTLRLATTTSFNNSGLSDVLLPAIKSDIGIDVQLLVVGTGQALRLGQAGDVDAILYIQEKLKMFLLQMVLAPTDVKLCTMILFWLVHRWIPQTSKVPSVPVKLSFV